MKQTGMWAAPSAPQVLVCNTMVVLNILGLLLLSRLNFYILFPQDIQVKIGLYAVGHRHMLHEENAQDFCIICTVFLWKEGSEMESHYHPFNITSWKCTIYLSIQTEAQEKNAVCKNSQSKTPGGNPEWCNYPSVSRIMQTPVSPTS